LPWDAPWPPFAGLFLDGPHDDTWFEVLGSGGFAVAVIGLCLTAGRIGSRGLIPLAATGSMGLTVYSVQIVAIWRWDLVDHPSNTTLGVMVVITLVAATAWRAFLGQGPLERLVAWVSKPVKVRGAKPPAQT
jgi:hypothetical protein